MPKRRHSGLTTGFPADALTDRRTRPAATRAPWRGRCGHNRRERLLRARLRHPREHRHIVNRKRDRRHHDDRDGRGEPCRKRRIAPAGNQRRSTAMKRIRTMPSQKSRRELTGPTPETEPAQPVEDRRQACKRCQNTNADNAEMITALMAKAENRRSELSPAARSRSRPPHRGR